MGRERIDAAVLSIAELLRVKSYKLYVRSYQPHIDLVEKACEKEKNVEKLELTDEQRQTIKEMMIAMSDANDSELTLTYMAGLLDGLAFLREVGLLNEEP